MPSDSKTDNPRPAATEAARDVIFNTLSGSDASAFMFVTGETDRILTALHDAGLTIAAAPPSGQVGVDDAISLRIPDARAIRAMLQRITKGPDAKVASYYVEDLTERIAALEGAAR